MKSSIIKLVSLVYFVGSFSLLSAQSFVWTTTPDGIFRDGEEFFLNGQSWAKKTGITYNAGSGAETQVKNALSYLNTIGVNAIRIYSSPDESDWDGSSNFNNLIKWIEEWNVENPDGGDPNNAMYYIIQLSPKDPQSSLSSYMPESSTASMNRAIFDVSNEGSVKSMDSFVDEITGGSKYLLAYLIYHELNVSSKYSEWMSSVGASGVEDFMNQVADAIHDDFAVGKLVAHTGDSKDISNGIYKAVEAIDNVTGNVFANFDMIGFNLYISTDGLLSEDEYYQRIVNRRILSVNDTRGWFIGETGASYDSEADASSVAAANYTNYQGGANLQIMWEKTKALGNMIGFMLFTVQDNDLGESIGNSMKQRGFFDVYGTKKYLYYIYSDIVNEISTNDRYHSTTEHSLRVKIVDSTSFFQVSFEFNNKTDESKQFLYTVHSDDGSSKQRFSIEEEKEYLTLEPGQDTIIEKTYVKQVTNSLLSISSNVIKDYAPFYPYLWGREHTLSDAISTVAGLNINSDNQPVGISSDERVQLINNNKDILSGKFIFNTDASLVIPNGNWELTIYNLNGTALITKKVSSNNRIQFNELVSGNSMGIGVYSLVQL